MEEERRNKLSPIAIIAILLEIVFVIFVIVTLNHVLTPEQSNPQIKIDNYSEIKNNVELEGNLDSDLDKEGFARAIYRMASYNSSDNLKNTGAKIREGSMRKLYLDEYDFQYMSFLVDLEDIGQTYRVIYRKGSEDTPSGLIGPDDYNAMLFCPQEDELIYPEFDCHEQFDRSYIDAIVNSLISFSYDKFDGFAVNPVFDKNRQYIESFELVMDSQNKNDQTNAIDEFKKYLDSIGINPDKYTYSVSTDFTHAEEM